MNLPIPPSPAPDFAEIQAAAKRLRAGGLVAFPTETVYGLGADALNEAAVKRVFASKGRPSNNPLIVHVTGVDMAATLVNGPLSEHATALMRRFWPGPLSIVLPRHQRVPDVVAGGAGSPTVALRCPDHPVALALLFAFGGPLVGPSANRSGNVSPTTAAHVIEEFGGDTMRAAADDDLTRDLDERVLVIDGGPGGCQIGLESTVVVLHDDRSGGGNAATILRPGVIGADQIEAVLEAPVGFGPSVADPSLGVPLPGPGMLGSHYAPKARTILFDDWADVEELADEAAEKKASLAVLSHSLMAEEADMPANARLYRLPPHAIDYAAALYRTLRQADNASTSLIAIHRPPLPQHSESPEVAAIWRAVHDRLTRATAPRL